MNESSEELKWEFKDDELEDELVQSENEVLKELFEVEDDFKENKIKCGLDILWV